MNKTKMATISGLPGHVHWRLGVNIYHSDVQDGVERKSAELRCDCLCWERELLQK